MGETIVEYAKLQYFKAEMKRVNSADTIKLSLETTSLYPDLQPIFKGIYIAFDCCKKGFLVGCRRVTALDGCYLKTAMKWQLFAAIGKDGNN